jgi:hypothetical protein
VSCICSEQFASSMSALSGFARQRETRCQFIQTHLDVFDLWDAKIANEYQSRRRPRLVITLHSSCMKHKPRCTQR